MINVSFSLMALVLSPIIFYMLLKWPKQKVEVIEASRVGICRRLAAVYIDFVVAMIGVLPLVCMPILILEYFETGKWVWSFQRDYLRPSDTLGLLTFFLGFYGIYYFFRWHFKHDKQTLGQHFLQFNLTPMEQKTRFSLRALIAWANLAWWPIWPWTIMQRKQDYWWDNASKIKARRVKKIL